MPRAWADANFLSVAGTRAAAAPHFRVAISEGNDFRRLRAELRGKRLKPSSIMNPDRAADDRFPDAVLVLSAPSALFFPHSALESQDAASRQTERAIRANEARLSN
jgi:hypothetical protein